MKVSVGKKDSDFILEYFNNDGALMVLKALEESSEFLWGREYAQSLLGCECVNG